MLRTKGILISAIQLAIFLIGCQKEELNRHSSRLCINDDKNETTKANIDEIAEYLVSEKDIEEYAHFWSVMEESPFDASSASISAHYRDDIPDYYVINYEKGWQIISADKRGPIILAQNYEGSFSQDSLIIESQMWLALLSDEIAYRRENSEEYYSSLTSKERANEEYCIREWRAICAEQEYVKEVGTPIITKHPEPIFFEDPPGHYELSWSYRTNTYLLSVDHLMTTLWHQNNPYNEFCPFTLDDTTRCPAGCVSIAGAQILYYLHYYLGAPEKSPSSGYCNGHSCWLYNTTDSSFYNYSSATWDVMDTPSDSLNYCGLLIGDVAKKAGVVFDEDGSAGHIYDLRNNVFPVYGVSCSYSTNYNKSDVFNSLYNGSPVLFGGVRFDSFDTSGHAFVIDGYYIYETRTHYVYDWVLDNPEDIELPSSIHESYEIVEHYGYEDYFKMNWGYGNYSVGGTSVNDMMFSTSGIWSNPTLPGSSPYQYFIEVAYSFSSN